ncbi:Peptidoglycan-N-acetylglucosamine deacetylase [compost metagenome]
MYLVKSPRLLKWLYPALTWNKSRTEKVVYLTFDDGPIPNVTEFVLNTLKTFQIKATFFCIGDNICKHPEIFEQLKKEGHSIGNHTFNHLNGWKTPAAVYVDNFLKCQALYPTTLFRPPYGRIKKSQIRKIKALNLSQTTHNPQHNAKSSAQIIMWDVLSGDFDPQLSPQQCYHNVIKHVQNGSIIVFHDSLKAFDRLQYALPKAIRYLSAAGYRFEKL